MLSPAPPLLANRLLALLPHAEYDRLGPYLEYVELSKGKIVYGAGEQMPDAYFPVSGMVSFLAATAQDETVEVGAVGSEGIIGLPIVLHANVAPYEVMVLISGSAYRIKADTLLLEFRRGAALHDVLLHYADRLLRRLSHATVCHRFHTSSQRLSRWLLMARDRVDSDSLEVTQESLAHVLGIQRTYVSAAAVELANADLIRYRHGKVTILNRRRLERAACECYAMFRDDVNPH